MDPVAAPDPFVPVPLDDARPAPAVRARSGLALLGVLIVLGVIAALSIGLAVVLLWAAFTAALG